MGEQYGCIKIRLAMSSNDASMQKCGAILLLAVAVVKRGNSRTLFMLQDFLLLRAQINALEHEVKDVKSGMFEMQLGKW